MDLDELTTVLRRHDRVPAQPGERISTDPPAVDRDAIRRAAEDQGFTSREPAPKRTRRKRSNRTAQVSFRVTPQTQARYHAYVDEHDVANAEFLDLALDALERIP